jgi:hypothetical protein
MSTIFPGSASVGQIFDGYEFNGTAWDIIGIDLTADYLESSTASSTYLTKVSASNTYLTQTSASTTYVSKPGSVLQVVNVTDTTQKTMSVGSLGSLMTASITPTRSSSKILITVNALVSNGTAGGLVVVRLSKSGTVLSPSVNFSFFTGSPNGHSVIADFNNTRNLIPYNLNLMDSPNTTSQVTYSFDGGAASGSTGFFNRWGLDSNWGGISSMTLMEIGA